MDDTHNILASPTFYAPSFILSFILCLVITQVLSSWTGFLAVFHVWSSSFAWPPRSENLAALTLISQRFFEMIKRVGLQKRDLQGQRHSFWAGFWRRAISVGLQWDIARSALNIKDIHDVSLAALNCIIRCKCTLANHSLQHA